MKPTYKRVKVWKEHCPVCKDQLSGENSQQYPFSCKCGEWKQDWFTGEFEVIKKETK